MPDKSTAEILFETANELGKTIKKLTSLRDAASRVTDCADMPTADDKPEEVISNFRLFVSAIDELKKELAKQ